MTRKEMYQAVSRVKEMLSDPKRWTTNAFARNKAGLRVPATDPSACQWCVWGAFLMDAKKHGYNPSALVRESFTVNLVRTNDFKGHAAIMDCLADAKRSLR